MLEERHDPGSQPAREAARSSPQDLATGAAPEAASATAAPEGVWRDWPTWLIAAVVLGAYLVISLYRLWTLTPSSWDLGIFTEYVKDYAHLRAPIVNVRGPGFNLLGDHFQVIVALIAPLFRVFPSPATLLVAQAVLTALSVFPVVQAGSALLGRGAGRAIGFAYGFSWGLQQMIDFDFHEIAFAVPLLAFSLSALLRGRARAALWWALPLVFVKEDQGFTVAAIGALMWLAAVRGGRKPSAGALSHIAGDAVGGAFLFCWGLGWSLVEITVIIPHFSPTHRYLYWDLGGVVGGGSPFSAVGLLQQVGHAYPVKLQTLALLLLPTAFIALGSPVAAVVVPSLLLRFISTNSSYWGTLYHYNATVMPVLFLAAVEAMSRWNRAAAAGRGDGLVREKWEIVKRGAARHGAAMMLAISVPLAFQFSLSGLWNGQTYEIGPGVAADQAAMAVVPSGATVTTTLTLLAPLAARCDTFWIGNNGNPDTQYIVFDGPNSGYSPAITNVPQFIAQLYPRADYRQVFSDDGVYVFKLGLYPREPAIYQAQAAVLAVRGGRGHDSYRVTKWADEGDNHMPQRIAIVTGAARGIGAATAKRLAADGMAVAVLDLDEAACADTVSQIEEAGGKALGVGADVSSADQVKAAVDKIAAELGEPTVLVNNAGVTRDNLLFKMSEGDWDTVMSVHLKGAFLMTRAVQGYMVNAKWGRIINLSSTSAVGNRGQVNYSAAKAGMQGYTKTLALELGKFGITANAVAPGFVATEMTKATAERLGMSFDDFKAASAKAIAVGRVGEPADIAAAVSFFAREEAGYVSGQILYAAGGPVS